MALYLTDAATAETAFALAGLDADGLVVLWRDGVARAADTPSTVPCYVLAPDLERRGLGTVVRNHIQRIDYAALVELLLHHTTVVNLG